MVELRDSPLLSSCSEDLYARIKTEAAEIDLAAGQVLFDEDTTADSVWLLVEGEIAISKRIEADSVPVDHLLPGAYLGEISLLTNSRAGHTATAAVPSKVVRIPGELFLELLRTCASTAHIVVKTLAERVRHIEHTLQKHERLAGLGALAAGLAHELNNPAAAARRASEKLVEVVGELPDLGLAFAARAWSSGELEIVNGLSREPELHTSPQPLDPIARGEREDATAEWLEEHGVPDAYESASCLIDTGLGPTELDALAERLPADALAVAVPWLAGVWLSGQLVGEVKQAAERIGDLVRAIKSYAKADSTTLRTVDVRADIVSTLLILKHKLGASKVATSTEFEASLPTIETFGTELYQVWSNIIDNAIDSMGAAGGKVSIRARRDGDDVAVEIEDTGPGIPEEIRGRIFDAFFTTKDVGKGTGLGLEIVKRIVARHHGSVDVASEPGRTRFTVVLPTTQPTQKKETA